MPIYDIAVAVACRTISLDLIHEGMRGMFALTGSCENMVDGVICTPRPYNHRSVDRNHSEEGISLGSGGATKVSPRRCRGTDLLLDSLI